MPPKTNSPLEKDIRVRVSAETKARIEGVVAARGEGVRESDIVREAILLYLSQNDGVKRLKQRKGTTPPAE